LAPVLPVTCFRVEELRPYFVEKGTQLKHAARDEVECQTILAPGEVQVRIDQIEMLYPIRVAEVLSMHPRRLVKIFEHTKFGIAPRFKVKSEIWLRELHAGCDLNE